MKIEYIGKKPFAVDNVAKSGKTWDGPGDIQEVTDEQGKILLKYPDQFKDVDAVAAPDPVPANPSPFDAMTREQLKAELDARELDFTARASKAELIALLQAA